MHNSRSWGATLQPSLVALAFLAAVAMTALISWPALTGPFLFDDFPNLENLAALDGRLDWKSLAHYMSLYRSEPGRPLSMLSFVINDYDWPSQPGPFKYTNLMLHLLVGTLIFGFARTLAALRAVTATQASLVALVASVAWLVHPMQLSTSMLVVQRMTQLSALFAFAGVWGYTALARRAERPAFAFAAISALGAGTILAFACKETGALTPLLAVVVNATVLRQRIEQLPSLSKRMLTWGAALPVLALLMALSWRLDLSVGYQSRDFTLPERLLSESRILVEYLYKIVLPSLRGGGIYHDDFVVSRGWLTPWTTAPAVAFVLGLVVVGIASRRRWPVLSFALLWFFAGHALESTALPLELYFEHRNYLPMFGILFALATWAVSAPARWAKPIRIVAVLWIGFAAWLTYVQAPIWGNRDALVLVWASEHPDSPRAVQEKAAYHYRRGENQVAAATLLDGYARGVRGSDFPSQVLLLACQTKDEPLAERALAVVPESLASAVPSNATPVTLRKLRLEVQRQACPGILDEAGWLELTETLLANPRYARGTAASYMHVERSYLFRHRRDLDGTMRELEAAWAARRSPELGQLIAATLSSAGLYDAAETWALRAQQHQVRGIRGIFARDDERTGQILEAIRMLKDRQAPGQTPATAPQEPAGQR